MKSYRRRMASLSLSILAGSAALLVTGCSHMVTYSLGRGEIYKGPVIAKSVQVKLLRDDAPQDEKINITVGETSWRINGREGYAKEESMAQGVSRQIATHLDHSGLFREVYSYWERPVYTDLILTGSIYDYAAMGRVRRKAETGIIIASSLLSLPGALVSTGATARIKTDLQTSVQLRDLKLIDPYTKTVVWSKDKIGRQRDFTGHFMKADAPKLYKLADKELKEVINEVIAEIANSPAVRAPRPVGPTGKPPSV